MSSVARTWTDAGEPTTASPGEREELVEVSVPRRLAAALHCACALRGGIHDEFVNQVERLAHAAAMRSAVDAPARQLEVRLDGTAFCVDGGEQVRIATRRSMRAILAHLVAEARTSPGRVTPPRVLIAVGWPDERIAERSAMQRLHATVRMLRALGLRGVVVWFETGYRIDPGVRVVALAEAAAEAPTPRTR